MVGFEKLKLGQVSAGYWGAHTSSIDWCELNYAYTPYIAEFINTLSNIPFILLGLYGFYRCRSEGLPRRYGWLMAGLAGIGVGSFGFHMTLKWAWQLMDELPMIYVATFAALLVFDTQPGLGMRWGKTGIVAVMLFNLFITLSYITLPNPIYHQLSFATLQLFSISRIVYLIRSRLPPTSAHPAKRDTIRLIGTGVAVFATSFLIWNLDNVFCETWRKLRERMGALGFLLEGHAMWHLGTGFGGYLIMVGLNYICLIAKTDVNQWAIEWKWIIPHVRPRIALPAKPAKDTNRKATTPTKATNGNTNGMAEKSTAQ